MARVDGDYSAAINHGSNRLWKSLAASRWTSLDLQKIRRVSNRALIMVVAFGVSGRPFRSRRLQAQVKRESRVV
jgi:hypothetical protein